MGQRFCRTLFVSVMSMSPFKPVMDDRSVRTSSRSLPCELFTVQIGAIRDLLSNLTSVAFEWKKNSYDKIPIFFSFNLCFLKLHFRTRHYTLC